MKTLYHSAIRAWLWSLTSTITMALIYLGASFMNTKSALRIWGQVHMSLRKHGVAIEEAVFGYGRVRNEMCVSTRDGDDGAGHSSDGRHASARQRPLGLKTSPDHCNTASQLFRIAPHHRDRPKAGYICANLSNLTSQLGWIKPYRAGSRFIDTLFA